MNDAVRLLDLLVAICGDQVRDITGPSSKRWAVGERPYGNT
jgi:hypothetical protein